MTEPAAPVENELAATGTSGATANNNNNDDVGFPRIRIKYCTQCKWMLRAAYVCPLLSFFFFFFPSLCTVSAAI